MLLSIFNPNNQIVFKKIIITEKIFKINPTKKICKNI
jgi:hypothetical protein